MQVEIIGGANVDADGNLCPNSPLVVVDREGMHPLSVFAGALRVADKFTVALEAVGDKIRMNSQGWEDARVLSERQVAMVMAHKGVLYLLPEHRPAKYERIDDEGLHEAVTLKHAGLLAGDWDDWRLLRRLSKEKEARLGEHIPAMLKPDDPGVLGAEITYPLRTPPIAMHIGEWRRDECGNRWREIMSEETFVDLSTVDR